MVSAIKKDGVPLYKLARQGKTVEREPRFVHVFAHEIKEVRLPEIDFRVACSKGFYVRTYALDIGKELGCGAHLKESAPDEIRAGSPWSARSRWMNSTLVPAETIRSRIFSLPEVSRLRGA